MHSGQAVAPTASLAPSALDRSDATCDTCVLSRRAVLGGAAAGVAIAVSGCATYGKPAAVDGGAPAAGGDGGAPAAGGAAGQVLAQLADVPVGGGKIIGDRGIVLTHPQQGTIKAFSATCTHQGCAVSTVDNGTINCSCHGSAFRIADGAVANGPATRPLAPVAVTVDGTAVRLV